LCNFVFAFSVFTVLMNKFLFLDGFVAFGGGVCICLNGDLGRSPQHGPGAGSMVGGQESSSLSIFVQKRPKVKDLNENSPRV